jgi:hypothetical protein
MHHEHIRIVHGMPGVGGMSQGRIVLDINAGQAPLLFAQDDILICKEVLTRLKKNAVETVILYFSGIDLDDIVAEGEGLTSPIITFVLFFVDGNINGIISL